jgi:hypothetical protein
MKFKSQGNIPSNQSEAILRHCQHLNNMSRAFYDSLPYVIRQLG